MQYFIYVPDKGVIQQSFRTPSQAHIYNHEYHLGGTVISEYQLAELQREAQQPDTRHRSFDNSIIKKPYQPRERNMRVPVQPYHQQCAPNYTRRYESFKPKIVRRRRKK